MLRLFRLDGSDELLAHLHCDNCYCIELFNVGRQLMCHAAATSFDECTPLRVWSEFVSVGIVDKEVRADCKLPAEVKRTSRAIVQPIVVDERLDARHLAILLSTMRRVESPLLRVGLCAALVRTVCNVSVMSIAIDQLAARLCDYHMAIRDELSECVEVRSSSARRSSLRKRNKHGEGDDDEVPLVGAAGALAFFIDIVTMTLSAFVEVGGKIDDEVERVEGLIAARNCKSGGGRGEERLERAVARFLKFKMLLQ